MDKIKSFKRPGDDEHDWVPISSIVSACNGTLQQSTIRKRATRREGGGDGLVWRPDEDQLPALTAAGALRFGATQVVMLRLDLVPFLCPEINGAPGRAPRRVKKRKSQVDSRESGDDDGGGERAGDDSNQHDAAVVDMQHGDAGGDDHDHDSHAGEVAGGGGEAGDDAGHDSHSEMMAGGGDEGLAPPAPPGGDTPAKRRRSGEAFQPPEDLTLTQRWMLDIVRHTGQSWVGKAKQHQFVKVASAIVCGKSSVKRSGTTHTRCTNADLVNSKLFIHVEVPSAGVSGLKSTVAVAAIDVWQKQANRLGLHASAPAAP